MIGKKVLEDLYVHQRLSMKQVGEVIGENERKVDYWLKKYSIEKRKISDAVYLRNNPEGDPFEISSFVKSDLIKNKYFLAGLGYGLYWGEGNKKNKSSIKLGTTDYRMVIKFIDFLENTFKINKDKLKYSLQIFTDISPKECIDFWAKNLRIKRTQIGKPTVTISGKVGNYKNKCKYGVLTVYFHNRKLRDFLVESLLKL